jgi:hypothetical protein
LKEKKKLGLKGIILLAVVVIGLFLALIGFLTDLLWFREMGYLSVFFKQIVTQLQIGIPLFVLLTAITLIFLKLLKRGYYKKVESNEEVNEKRLGQITFLISVVFAALASFMAAKALWFEALKFTNATDFAKADPLFNMDISFYIFKLAFIEQVNTFIIGIVIGYAVISVLYYSILLSMRTPQMYESAEDPDGFEEEDPFQGNQVPPRGGRKGFGFDNLNDMFENMGRQFQRGGNIRQTRRPKKQFDDDNFRQLLSIAQKELIVLGAIFFVMLAVNFFLKQYGLLYSSLGAVYGAGFTDVNVTLWMYRLLIGLSLVAAVTFAIGVVKKKFKIILLLPVVMIIVGAVGTGGSTLIQNLVVSPDEINKEMEYLEYNIAYTQFAYDLDKVDIRPFAATNTLTNEDIANNQETISNIRINDYEPAKKFYNQTQSIRLYYTFNDVDVDRYVVNGEYTQTFLSAREIDETLISETWLNQHIKYTHGYGITLSRVDKVTASGQPDMLIDSIPPVSQVEEIQIQRPEIYFGELTNNYILVGTDEEEFDYPDGDVNQYTMYEGDAGIKLNLLNRVMFAIREQSLKLLVSTNLDSDSRIIINRNIMERVKTIMPYLAYENDPYIVVIDGKLFWIIDAYTTSDKYPYSEPYSEGTRINYIRNSVKVVIDAYNGTATYYLVDDKDPIANTFMNIYPDLFKSFDQMPDEVRCHIRYPSTMLNIQANVYARYHMSNVRVFYQDEDLWDIGREIFGTTETIMTPTYYIMKLPGEQKAEFVNTIAYTPRDRRNLMALLLARNDGDNYGELVLYQLPKDRIIYGPMQIEAQIDQHPEISKEFSLWNSSGSNYSRGNLFIIPIEESLLYVEPVYLEATNSSLPEVKRVIVAYGDRIAYEETLAQALESLFGATTDGGTSEDGTPSGGGVSSDLTQAELILKAAAAYENAISAQKAGRWADYGTHMATLQKLLAALESMTNNEASMDVIPEELLEELELEMD